MLSPADAGKKDSGRDLGSAEAGGTPDGGAGDVGGPSPTTDASSIDTRPVETGSPDAGAPDTATPQPKPDTAPVVEAAPPEAAPPAPPVENPPPEFPVAAWLREARIAGVDGSLEPEELAVILDACVAQGVSVIEFDSILSHYLTDAAGLALVLAAKLARMMNRDSLEAAAMAARSAAAGTGLAVVETVAAPPVLGETMFWAIAGPAATSIPSMTAARA